MAMLVQLRLCSPFCPVVEKFVVFGFCRNRVANALWRRWHFNEGLLFGLPIRWGMGYALNCPLVRSVFGSNLEGRRVACWGGSGGSFVFNDLDAR